jgi:hypothetical protein
MEQGPSRESLCKIDNQHFSEEFFTVMVEEYNAFWNAIGDWVQKVSYQLPVNMNQKDQAKHLPLLPPNMQETHK